MPIVLAAGRYTHSGTRGDLQPKMNNSDAVAGQSASVARLPTKIALTIPHSLQEVPVCRNPIPPALGLHLYSALVNPVHEQKIVPNHVVISRTLAAKSVVSERCRKPNPLLVSLAEGPGSFRAGIAVYLQCT
jgi:hypothetical protein